MKKQKNELRDDITIPKFVKGRCNTANEITISQDDKGMYVLIVDNVDKKQVQQMSLTEDGLIGVLTMMLVYTEHYEMDVSEKVRELTKGSVLHFSSNK